MRILEIALSGTIGTCHMGPVSTAVCELSSRFAARGHDVTLVDVPGDSPRSLLHPDVKLLELSGLPQSRIASQMRNRYLAQVMAWHNYFRCLRELNARVNFSSFDVNHFHSPHPAFLAQRLYGIDSIFYTAHTPNWSLTPIRWRSVIGQLMMRMERDMIRRSRLSVGLGDYLASAVPGANVVTIANGLDSEAWPVIQRSEARRALGINAHEFMMVFAGRIQHIKGVDTLLDAIGQVATSLPSLRAYLIGPLSGSFDTRDEYVDPYARQMLDRSQGLPVQFLGFINNRDLRFRQYLAAADVFVLPSRSEPQGLVVLEALATGTPVIGSATGGIPDMVTPEVGYLFPPEDADALAACIRHANDNPERLRQMRLAARSRVEVHYSWEDVADRYLAEFTRRILPTASHEQHDVHSLPSIVRSH